MSNRYINVTNNGLTDRLLFLMNKKGISGYLLSKETQISNATISRIISKKTRPSENIINIICNYFDIKRDWLLTGRGEMLKEKERKKIYEINDSKPTIASGPDITGRNIESVKQEYEEKIELLKERLADKDKQVSSLERQIALLESNTQMMLSMKDEVIKSKEETLKKSDENYKLLIEQYQAEIQKLKQKQDIFDRTDIPVYQSVTVDHKGQTTIMEQVKKISSSGLTQEIPNAPVGK